MSPCSCQFGDYTNYKNKTQVVKSWIFIYIVHYIISTILLQYFNDFKWTYFCFFPLGSPYYYSATSRGAGPAATATASAYDRHWPLLLRDEEDEEKETREEGMDG